MRIVVTGSSGRLGLHVVRELLAHNYDVIPVDRRDHHDPALPATRVVDLSQPVDYCELFRGAQVVCHLGNLPGFGYSRTSGVSSASGFSQNVTSTYVAFDAAFEMGVRHFVYASSINAYGVCQIVDDRPGQTPTPKYLPVDENHPCIPCDGYPLSKYVGEEIAQAFVRRDAALTAYSLRFPSILMNHPPGVGRQRPPDRVSGSLMAYIHVTDAARAVRMCCQQPRPGHTPLNVCSPRAISPWNREMILASYGTVPEIRGNPRPEDPLMTFNRAKDILGFTAEFDPAGQPLAKI